MEYPKDSMDRLGDDLTELILSHLSFEDKVRLECVSKQWRRLIYTKQYALEVNARGIENRNTVNKLIRRVTQGISEIVVIHKTSLKTLLKKCPHIKTFKVQVPTDGSELEVVAEYCPSLRELECDITDLNQNILLYFGAKLGFKLTKLKFEGMSYSSLDLMYFLKLCPNLRAIDMEPDSLFISKEKNFLPKLEVIERIQIRHKSSDLFRKFEILTEKYSNTLKSLQLIMYNYSILQNYQIVGNQLKTVISYVSKFKNLRSLELMLFDGNDENITEPIDDSLALVGKMCTRLTKLKMVVCGRHLVSERFFSAISQFRSIEKMYLELKVRKKMEDSVDCMKLPKLQYLHIECDGLNTDFFDNIEKVVPNLQYINIKAFDKHKVWKRF